MRSKLAYWRLMNPINFYRIKNWILMNQINFSENKIKVVRKKDKIQKNINLKIKQPRGKNR